MKLTFNSAEIEQALISFVSTQGIDLANKTVVVNMTAGRGPNGHTAELDITTKPVVDEVVPIIAEPKVPEAFIEDKVETAADEPADDTNIMFAAD